MREGIERMQDLWVWFAQTTQRGVIQVGSDAAVGRAYIQEFTSLRHGSSHLNYAVYRNRSSHVEDCNFAECLRSQIRGYEFVGKFGA
jgi:hypothetical protein